MARARNIKPGFFRNEIIGEMPVEFRLLFIGLWTAADREGRLEYRPKRIKAEIFPYDDINVMDGLSMLRECGFIEIYISNDQELIQVINWSKHQNPHHKEIASVLPAPEGHKDTVCAGYIPLNNTIRNRIYQRDGRKCKHCGVEHGLSIDHIIPVSKGGNSVDENLQVLCIGCNIRKGNTISNMVHAQVIDESYINNKQVDISGSSPLDSLIPDSLIPDSLIPDSLKPIPEKKPTVANAPPFLLPDWVNSEDWNLWLKTRKGKKMIHEQMAAQIKKLDRWRSAGLDYGKSLNDAAASGWLGLVEPVPRGGAPPNRDAARQAAASSIFKDEHIQHLMGEKLNEPSIDADFTRVD